MKISNENKIHFQMALLCPNNWHVARKKYKCDDHVVYKHPIWLFRAYFENAKVSLTKEDKLEILLFARTELGRQAIIACVDLLNRHGTMEECECLGNVQYLKEHPDKPLMHFVTSGGAKAFRDWRNMINSRCEAIRDKTSQP